jgi:hypothetical protein
LNEGPQLLAIQAAIVGRIVARETVKPFRKDVTAKCYGGDVTRKRKLLEKQNEGKKRMRQVGKIEIPRKPSWRPSRWKGERHRVRAGEPTSQTGRSPIRTRPEVDGGCAEN